MFKEFKYCSSAAENKLIALTGQLHSHAVRKYAIRSNPSKVKDSFSEQRITGQEVPCVGLEPYSLGYERTRGEMSVAYASRHAPLHDTYIPMLGRVSFSLNSALHPTYCTK